MKHFNPHPKQVYASHFSPEQWQEIVGVRARLEAYKLKIQPYPLLLEEEQAETKYVQPEWAGKQWDKVQQLQGMVLHLQNKVAELSKQKKQGKDTY